MPITIVLFAYVPQAPDSSSEEDKFIVWRFFSSTRGLKSSILMLPQEGYSNQKYCIILIWNKSILFLPKTSVGTTIQNHASKTTVSGDIGEYAI